MGRPGSGLDNAVIESWHSTLEFELRRLEHFDTKAQARACGRGVHRRLQPTPDATPLSECASPINYEQDLARHDRCSSRPPSMASSSPASRPSPFGWQCRVVWWPGRTSRTGVIAACRAHVGAGVGAGEESETSPLGELSEHVAGLDAEVVG